MHSLELLWRAASSVQFVTTRAHWQQMLGDSFGLIEHLLLATGELGSHVPKPGCNWTWYRVAENDQSTVVTIDDDRGVVGTIPRRDALALQVNWRLVYRSLCQSIGIELNDRGVDGIQHLRLLGSIRPAAGIDLHFYHATARPDESVSQLAAIGNVPFLMVHTSRNGVGTTGKLLLKSSQSLELSLLGCTELDSSSQVVFTSQGRDAINAFCELHAPTCNASDSIALLSPPKDAKWCDAHIRFIDGDNIRIAIADQSANFHYSRLGMASQRNAKPTKQWQLLRAYAVNRGVITWRDSGSAANVKKQTQELNQKLVTALGIDGVPIEYDRTIKGYRTVFKIEDC